MCRLFHLYGPACQEAIEGYEDGVWLHEMFRVEIEYLGFEIARQRHIERYKKWIEKKYPWPKDRTG